MAKRIIITICGRAGSKGFLNKNLKEFCGKPLVHYSLSAADLFHKRRQDLEVDIVLNTDSEALHDLVLGKYPEVVFLSRPEALCGDTVPKMAVFQQSIREMEQRRGEMYDCHIDLDITSPLRTLQDVAGCFSMLEKRADLDLVMSAVKSRRNPFMNMAIRVEDHVEPVVRSHYVARQQTPPCYDLNASIYAFRRDFLAENNSAYIWDAKSDVYEMLDTGVLDIDSEEDFEMMELIAWQLFLKRGDFAQIRDNIR